MRRFAVAAALLVAVSLGPASPAAARGDQTCTAKISLPTTAVQRSLDLGTGYGITPTAAAKRTLAKRLAAAKRQYKRSVAAATSGCKRAVRAARLARAAQRSKARSNTERICAGAEYQAALTQRRTAREAAVYAAFDVWAARVDAAYAEFDAAVATSPVRTARAAFRIKSGSARSTFASRVDGAAAAFVRARQAARLDLQQQVATAATDMDVVDAWDDYNAVLQAALTAASRERSAGLPVLRSAITLARGEYDDDLNEIESEDDAESSSSSDSSEPVTASVSMTDAKHRGGPRPR